MTLALGQPAPSFSLKDQHGQTVTLEQYIGKNLVVVFYPFAFSGVCTGELEEIRDNLDDLETDSSGLVAVSCDSMYSLRIFAERDRLSFPLLSDFWPHGAVSLAYEVFNERIGCPTRSTVVVDREGLVRWQVTTEMSQSRDMSAYRKVLAELA